MKRFGKSDAACAGYLKMLGRRITASDLGGTAVNLIKSELSRMRSEAGTETSIKTYTTALHVCKHWKCWDSAKEILEMMRTDNIATSKAAVELAAQSSRTVAEATSVLQQLRMDYPTQAAGFPTPDICAHLAMLVLNKEKKTTAPISAVMSSKRDPPNESNRQAAISLLRSIPAAQMTENCWQVLLHCQKNLQAALLVFNEIPEHHKSIRCYNTLLVHCQRDPNGRESAESVFIEMKKRKGDSAPNRVSWNRLLRVYTELGTLEECHNCFKRKIEANIEMDPGDVVYLLTSCSNDILRLRTDDVLKGDEKSKKRASAVIFFAESVFRRLELMETKKRSTNTYIRLLIVYFQGMQFIDIGSDVWTSKCLATLTLFKSRHLQPTATLFSVAAEIEAITGPIGLTDILKTIREKKSTPNRIPTKLLETHNIIEPTRQGLNPLK
eukprot:TRINITY_DN33822_c0_g1_i1.p1 TRINITY_DN33822_c0_g1~~TRINITY_DN33822_c0_g1_i1.p1  ORF type:complete len:440 (+),score=76.63 TRINITY_DN33822_c0_g1_i1:67-1386(+)